MKKKTTIYFIFIGIILLIINVTVWSVAKAQAEDNELQLVPNQEDLFVDMKNMLPGESRTQNISIINGGKEKYFFYLEARNSTLNDFKQDTKAWAASARLLEKIEMEVILYTAKDSKSEKLLYKGKANQLKDQGNQQLLVGRTVELGELLPLEKASLKVTVTIPEELDNTYEFIQGKFWWHFYFSKVSLMPTPTTAPDPTSTPSTSPITTTPSNRPNQSSPKTGESSKYQEICIIAILLISSGLIIGSLLKRRQNSRK